MYVVEGAAGQWLRSLIIWRAVSVVNLCWAPLVRWLEGVLLVLVLGEVFWPVLFSLSVWSPDFCQLSLSPQLLWVVWTVLHCVGIMARIVTDRTLVDIKCWADHLVVRVLQHVRGVHWFGLVVVLAKYTKCWKLSCFLHFFLSLHTFERWRKVFKSALCWLTIWPCMLLHGVLSPTLFQSLNTEEYQSACPLVLFLVQLQPLPVRCHSAAHSTLTRPGPWPLTSGH